MRVAVFDSEKVRKEISLNGGEWACSRYINLVTGKINAVKEEFVLVWREKEKGRKRLIFSRNCAAEEIENGIEFRCGDFRIRHIYSQGKSGVLEKHTSIFAPENVFIERVVQEDVVVDRNRFYFSAPDAGNTFIPGAIARLGQPVYLKDMYFGQQTPVGDNCIKTFTARFLYHTGRAFKDVAEFGCYELPPLVVGAAEDENEDSVRNAFFDYLYTVIRKPRFRIQYNSWYDNKLDITSDRIEKSFKAIAKGFEKTGLRPLDCYVVDDGWTEYKKPLFWEFNDKFKGGFSKEKELVKELGSRFGVWFGPRGGYTSQTYKYAKLLERIGYHVNERSRDICTADAAYVDALCSKMAEFCKLYDVDYFKIDGFAYAPCKKKGHNHPAAKGDSKAFYTYLWEEWTKGFEKIRKENPDVCLNITSYAHCSPWFLMWADYVWMNNASDMYFAGKGSVMQQCLNYRDSRYRDLFVRRRYQFPAAHLYNHEPTYARRNYKNTRDYIADKPIIYTDEEFALYVRCCLTRGSGLAELYFSPEMMTEEKWKSAARELEYAEKNFDLLSRSRFFGGRPEKGEVYGYIAEKEGRYILMLRNPSAKTAEYYFDLPGVGRKAGILGPQQIIFEEKL